MVLVAEHGRGEHRGGDRVGVREYGLLDGLAVPAELDGFADGDVVGGEDLGVEVEVDGGARDAAGDDLEARSLSGCSSVVPTPMSRRSRRLQRAGADARLGDGVEDHPVEVGLAVVLERWRGPVVARALDQDCLDLLAP